MRSIKNKKSIPNWIYVITAFIIIVVVPGSMASLMLYPRFSGAPGGIDGWLSYWGSYLGGVIGLVAVVATTAHLVKKQDINHQEQMKMQNSQHLELLRDQDRHHRNQIDEQRIAIERAARLNDNTERDRIYIAFLLKKNEEVLGVLTEIVRLYLKRHNLLRVIANYNSFLLIKDANQSEDVKNFIAVINKANDDDSIVRGEIVQMLTELRIKSSYFPKHQNKAFNFSDKLQKTFEEIHKILEINNFSSDLLLRKAEEYKKWVESELQSLLELFKQELESTLKDLRNNNSPE